MIMGMFDDYKAEEVQRLEPGDHRVYVVDVEETVSKSSGKPMAVITVVPNGSNIRIKHYVVKNDYFNQNMTTFFDCFGIPRGSKNTLEWIGAVGAAKLVEDENGYLKIRWLISPDKQDKLPPWVGPLPERQTVNGGFADAEDEGDLPF